MFHHEITAAAARERQKSWLAEAERARLARRARQARRTPADRHFSLRDGSEVLIRRVRGTDAPLLADGFARLSLSSRWMRFLIAKQELSPAELHYLTEVDHHDHEALGALDEAEGRGVGIARYIRLPADPQAAEVAITVVDEWQRLGLGTVLLAQLSVRARAEGIHRFTALVAAENDAGLRLLRRANAQFIRREADTAEFEIPLRTAAARAWPAQLRPLGPPRR
jgi:ribosomal protein S18 acetylase RimI-like enzyme